MRQLTQEGMMAIGHKIYGSGSSVVIVLHGWFGDHTVFEPVFPFLDTDTFTYVFLDYRGYGLSRNIAGTHTMQEIADDTVELANELGWEQFHVIGHSMGGMALMRIATDHPQRVKSGVALTPVPPSGVPLDEDGEALFGGAAENDENRRMILDFTTGCRLSGHWLDLRVRRSRETTTVEAYADYLVAWTQTNFAEESKGLELPLLVCPGEYDGALTADVMKQTYLEWYPNAELEILPNSGHYPMQEIPVYLTTVTENFMREHL
jgi:pimeloyl-ACP methyl ester carboxylesterase